MPSAYIETDFAWVRLHGQRLQVFSPKDDDPSDDLLQEIPLLGLERLILREHVQITTEAACALLRAAIPIHLVDWKGDPLGALLRPVNAEAAFRLQQYRRTLDPEFTLPFVRAVVAAKIANQQRVLQRLQSGRVKLAPEEAAALTPLLDALPSGQDIDTLRGMEGRAAAVYYPLWSRFLPPEFPFERRSTRPPHNAVNACLSYANTLLYHDVVAALHLRGLDPGLGLLHVTEDGRWSLALDLMEPFRPALAEALTLRLFSHRILGEADFEARDNGVFLAAAGRKTVIAHYERRLDRSFLSEQAAHRTTLRQAMTDQVLSYKAALGGGLADFRPFRLN